MASSGEARELRILNTIAEALNSATDVPQALERTLALVAELLGLETGWVWLIDPETQQFYNAAARNLPPWLQQPVRMTGNSCWCLDSFRAGELTPANITLMGCSRLRDAITAGDPESTRGLRSHASIPLMFQERPLGVMNITGPAGRKLTRRELRLLSTIAYQVGIAVERARLSEAAARLARAEERARIAREIHDTLAQDLTAIALQIESALPRLIDNPDLARARLQRALDLSRTSLEQARRSVLEIRAALPAGKTLAAALGDLARAFTTETGVRVRLAVEAVALPPALEIELLRIAQEALMNIRRHAHATEATVSLTTHEERVRLTIRDDGQGFDPHTALPGTHHGLLGMRERARLIGGSLRLTSRPGRGTTVTFEGRVEARS